jgi:hypothetical protein
VIEKGTKMSIEGLLLDSGVDLAFEDKVLDVVESITSVHAYFYNGTLFLETIDSKIATDVFFALCDKVTPALAYGKCGEETSYDFL